MSRIGKAIITVPAGVEISQNAGTITVKGKHGQLHQALDECVEMAMDNGVITFTRK